jgi:hypothetical protein
MATKTTEVINHRMMLRRAARIMADIRRNNEEFYEDRRQNGWTSLNPHCKHGTFIGDPYGADYLCGYCEDGTSDYEIAIGQAHQEAARDGEHWKTLFEMLVRLREEFRFDRPEGYDAIMDELDNRLFVIVEKYQ